MKFVAPLLVLAVGIAIVTIFVVHPSAPREPWWHRLACVLPLSLVAGVVLAYFSTGT